MHSHMSVAIVAIISALAGASMTGVIALFILQAQVEGVRWELRDHIEESDPIHIKMMQFMASGPRFSKIDGLRQCAAIEELQKAVYAESDKPVAMIECK